MNEQIEEIRRFNYCEGIDRFILDRDKCFDGEYAMIAARNERPACFYDELRPLAKKAKRRINIQDSRLIYLRLGNRFGVVKCRFVLGAFTFDECCRLAMECGRSTFLYATGHDAPYEYECQTREPIFHGDFRRTLAHWLLPPKSHEIFTVSREIEPTSISEYALNSEYAREKMWRPIFELSNKRLPLKGPKVICANDRFVWHADKYKGWSEFLRPDDKVTIIPYKGWTPELMIGDGSFFFEIWKNATPENLLKPGELCINGAEGGYFQPVVCDEKTVEPLPTEFYETRDWFRVCRKSDKPPFKVETVQTGMTLATACQFLLNLQQHYTSFAPTVVCTKGRGNLKALMDDPQSTFIIASCWKPCRQEGEKCVPLDARENIFRHPPVLDLFGHINAFPNDENLQDKTKRSLLVELQTKCPFSTLILRCGGRNIDSRMQLDPNPCWNYIVSDYQSDSVCFFLKPGYSKEGFETLKETVMDRLAFLGVEALFVKEREECYALGCRSEELTLTYLGDSTIHFPKNRGKSLPLNIAEGIVHSLSENVRISLFSFLYKLYNHGAYGFAEVENLPEKMRTQINVPYIEEEIYRGNICEEEYGISGVMHYRHGCRPVRRSQWERIDK